jgi:hypothetical protein
MKIIHKQVNSVSGNMKHLKSSKEHNQVLIESVTFVKSHSHDYKILSSVVKY